MSDLTLRDKTIIDGIFSPSYEGDVVVILCIQNVVFIN